MIDVFTMSEQEWKDHCAKMEARRKEVTSKPTYEQLEAQLRLSENSNLALRIALRKAKVLSQKRYQRLKNAHKQLKAAKSALALATYEEPAP